jgi:peptide/nickel transport system substrate-binding protein
MEPSLIREATLTSEYNHSSISSILRQHAERKIDRREFLRAATLLGMSAAAAYGIAGIADPRAAQAQTTLPKGGSIRVHNRLDKLSHLHALAYVYTANVTRGFAEYLAETGPDNVTRPLLLEKWTPSEDLRTWDLHLRRGVKWRKGRDFTADDVVWNFKSILDPKTGSSLVGLMKGYMLNETEKDGKKTTELWDANAIEKVDDYTVRLNTKVPQLFVPQHLSHYACPIIDPEENGNSQPGANGTGPFELVEYEPRRHAVLKARKDYWGEGPYVDTFEYVDLGDDASAQLAALAANQVDGLVEAQIAQYQTLKQLPQLQEYTVDTAVTFIVRGKVSQKPFDDPKFRRALRLATDVEATTAICRGSLGSPAENHHVSPVQPDYQAIPKVPRDVAKAKQLLSEAGYPDGIDIEEPLTFPKDIEWLATAAQALAQQWSEAGIRVKLNLMPAAQYWEVWQKVPFGITRWNHNPVGVMTLGLAYRTGVPWNEAGYSNPKFDELLGKAESTVNMEDMRKIVGELETIMQTDGPIVQTTWAKNVTFYNKRVQGFAMHPSLFIFPGKMAVAPA